MQTLKIIAMTVLILLIAQGKTFAEMPEISAGETYFDMFKGVYVLKNNVKVSLNNHGFKAKISADAAEVSVINQKCRAQGNVKLEQENTVFSCDDAYLQWATKTAEVKGNVKFENTSITITSDSAVFNWHDKIIDFYGKVKLSSTADKEYQHVKYNVVENKITDAPDCRRLENRTGV